MKYQFIDNQTYLVHRGGGIPIRLVSVWPEKWKKKSKNVIIKDSTLRNTKPLESKPRP